MKKLLLSAVLALGVAWPAQAGVKCSGTPCIDSAGGVTSPVTVDPLTFSGALTFDNAANTPLICADGLKDSTLTATRVTFAGAAGRLADDADLTFATDTLTATKITVATTLTSPNLVSAAGVTEAISSTAPTQVAASVAGSPVTITASNATAGASVAGAAAGGPITLTAGNAARLTSGNANGGNISLVPGTGIGTGAPGSVVVTGGTLVESSALTVNATVPGSTSGANSALKVAATGSGAGSYVIGLDAQILAGYTGPSGTYASSLINASAGTGEGVFGASGGTGNFGVRSQAVATATGTNVGSGARAFGGNANYGGFFEAVGTKNGATNIGVAGFGLNAGTTPTQIGGYFGLQSTLPTYTSAALIADNAAVAAPIFIARDNGAAVFTIADSGWVEVGAGLGRSRVNADVTNATVTMANVTGLSATLIAGRKYSFELRLFAADSVAADGIAIDFDGGTATMTSFRAHVEIEDAALETSAQVTALATDTQAATFTGDGIIKVSGGFVVNAAGTFIPRFAQVAHTTGTATVYANSWMWLEDMP